MRNILLVSTFIFVSPFISCEPKKDTWTIPAEFEKQEYIWFSWVPYGFLGGEPFYTTILQAVKEIHPYVKVKIYYGELPKFDKATTEKQIFEKLLENKIDTSRIELIFGNMVFGSLQDPGPVFLLDGKGNMALADFRYQHPDKRAEEIDRHIAKQMNLPVVSSELFSEGGAWQTNGQGTMLLVESVELDRNPKLTKEQIENEYKRVLGVTKIIWLKNGPKEEEWKKLENGIYGIGTGGHIDEFCRFTDTHTVLLAEVPAKDTVENPISKETFNRMETNYEILKNSTLQDGKPFKIIRIPTMPLISKKVNYQKLHPIEQSYFANVTTDTVAFYLPAGYMNFVIANDIIITSKYWKEGLPEEYRLRDELAKAALEKAFVSRKIVQIDCMPVHHDGAGLHCHSRNQPIKVAANRAGGLTACR
ncbi:hypothetical protein DC498_09815 [Terrimonas sp.]|uniref:agmatine deiminase family protein n=1 Tax=Terrimonas sp. TaxID=1914338 RepID=UPI000D511513|nr:agmatine deiminase family protein [Terrimonas sp.]PVD52395.1 hypothetical protein DC498_09815 [Terrimonas sp.]